MGDFHSGKELTYQNYLPGNGVYLFVLRGDLEVNRQHLTSRDGVGLNPGETLNLKAISDSEVLLMEVPA